MNITGSLPVTIEWPCAWLGEAKGFAKPTARICSWCPKSEVKAAEMLASLFDMDVTHSMCPGCLAREKAKATAYHIARGAKP